MSVVLVRLTKSGGSVTQEEVEEFERKFEAARYEEENREDGEDTYLVTHLHVSVDRWAFERRSRSQYQTSSSEDEEILTTSVEQVDLPSSEDGERRPNSSSSSEEFEYDIIEAMDVE
jgi:hypothetical protein